MLEAHNQQGEAVETPSTVQVEPPAPKTTEQKKSPRLFQPIGWGWRRVVSNPIILKELRKRMRNWRTALSLALYVGVLGIVALITYSLTAPNYYNPYNYYGGYSYRSSANAGAGIYTAITVAQLILMGFLVPAFTAGVLTSEKERQTYDILLLTLLRPFDIVFGKLISSLAYIILLIICSLPVVSIAFLVGGIAIDQLIAGLIICVATALFFGSLGIWWSALTTTTGRAIRNTLFTLLILVMGIPALGWFLLISNNISSSDVTNMYIFLIMVSLNPVVAIIATTSILSNYSSQTRNIIFWESNDIFYPQPWLIFTAIAIIMTIVLLSATVKSVKPVNVREGSGKIGRRGKAR